MSEDARYALLAFSTALLIPGVTGLWKAGSLRGDTNEKWRDRVDLAIAALSERAVAQLRILRRSINDVLGPEFQGVEEKFDPLTVVVDPSKFSEPVGKFQHCIQVRNKLRRRFRALLRLGTALIISTGLYLLGLITSTLYFGKFTKYTDNRWIGVTGSVLFLLGVLGMASVLVVYIYLQQRLSSAEILSEEE